MCIRCPPTSPRLSPSPSTDRTPRLSILEWIYFNLTNIFFATSLNQKIFRSKDVQRTQGFTIEADSRLKPYAYVSSIPTPSEVNMDTPPTSALCLSQTTLSMAMSGMEASGRSTHLSHHHLHHPRHIDPEEEGQEAEEERKRGDAPPDDSHLTVHMLCQLRLLICCYLPYLIPEYISIPSYLIPRQAHSLLL